MDSSDYNSALKPLYDRVNYERTSPASYNSQHYRLDRMRRLLEYLDNPQREYSVIHIAGTKGKGTTANLIYRGLQANGIKAGLYTSPHLLRVEERIQFNGSVCDPQDFVRLAEVILEAANRLDTSELGRPTFFEITTAMGMLHFAQQSADCAVLEVGLGGRLDSTNVCQPLLTLITSISLDHQAQLGSTIAQIAAEKAGIIKPCAPVISTATHAEAREVIQRVANENQCQLLQLDRDFSYTWSPVLPDTTTCNSLAACAQIEYSTRANDFLLGDEAWQLSMLGRHQGQNLAGTITALNWLSANGAYRIDPRLTRNALVETQVTGRLQIVGSDPVRIIDTAHNPASVLAALESIHDHFGQPATTFVFASSRDKDYATMLRLLLPRCKRLICTAFLKNPRAVPPDDLVALARQLQSEFDKTQPTENKPTIQVAESPELAWQQAVERCSKEELVVSIGSFFLAAELLEHSDRL